MRWLSISVVLLLFCLVVMGSIPPEQEVGPDGGVNTGELGPPSAAVQEAQTWLFQTDDGTCPGGAHWPGAPDVTKQDPGDGSVYRIHDINKGSAGDDSCLVDTDNARVLLATATNANFPIDTQKLSLMWFDLELLPEYCRIDSAFLGIALQGAETMTEPTYAVLDTFPGHVAWTTANSCCNEANAAYASWNYADAENKTAWDPVLDDLDKWWKWGIPSAPMTDVNWGDKEVLEFDVGEQLSIWNKYRPSNAGWVFANETAANPWYYWAYSSSTGDTLQPYLTVYLTTNATEEFKWHGKPFAAVISTDDNLYVNLDWADTLEEYDWRLSLCIFEDGIGHPHEDSTTFLDASELTTLFNAGHEMVAHSRWHGWRPPEGFSIPDSQVTVICAGPDTVNGMMLGWSTLDSLGIDGERQWLADTVGIDVSNIKIFAWPGGIHNVGGDSLMQLKGYLGAFVTAAGGTLQCDVAPTGKVGDLANDLAFGDTLSVFALRRLSITTIFGNDAFDPDETGAKSRIDSLLWYSQIDGQWPLVLFLHDTEDDSRYPNEGASPAELGWVANYLREKDMVWMTTPTPLLQWYMKQATPVDCPTTGEISTAVAADSIYWIWD